MKSAGNGTTKKARKPLSPVKAFLALPDEEKEKVYQQFDRQFALEETRPLTPAQRRLWEKAKRRGRGRPKVGKGARTVSVTVEGGLLERTDAYAKSNGLTRAQVIARGLEAVVGPG